MKSRPTTLRTSRFFVVLCLLLVSSCTRVPDLTGLIPGREMQTLQSAVSVSIRQENAKQGARGFLVLQRPDQFHLAILSPFGQSLLEIYSRGGTLTCIVPGKKAAYTGNVHDLTEQQGSRLWGLMQWVIQPPPGHTQEGREQTVITSGGRSERLTYDSRGMILRRVSDQGDQVVYSDYHVIDGVPFPLLMELTDIYNNHISLIFDDPEINQPVDPESLIPPLANMQVFPLALFNGL